MSGEPEVAYIREVGRDGFPPSGRRGFCARQRGGMGDGNPIRRRLNRSRDSESECPQCRTVSLTLDEAVLSAVSEALPAADVNVHFRRAGRWPAE